MDRETPLAKKTGALLVVLAFALAAGSASLLPSASAQSTYTFTLTPSSGTVQTGSQVSFTGTICPSPSPQLSLGANITYTAPNGTEFYRAGSLGYGSSWCSSPFGVDTLVPDSSGTWSAVAWAIWTDSSTGNYEQVESNTVTLQVSPPTTTTTTTTLPSTTTVPGQTTTTSTSPSSACDAPSQGNSSAVSLDAGCYNYQTLSIASDSVVVYYSESTTPIDTGLMTPGELANFQQTGDFAGSVGQYGSYQNGTKNLNALLLTQGVYYLVVDTLSAPAQVNYTSYVDSNLAVQNDTTSVGSFLTVPPSSTLGIAVHDETTGSPSTLSIFGISNVTLRYTLLDADTNSYVPPLTPDASPDVTVTNLTESAAGPVTGYNLSLPMATYVVRLTNPNPTPAFAFFSYDISPAYVDPYLAYGNESDPAPTGLAAYGVTPQGSGSPSTYYVTTGTVIGFANITSIQSTSSCRGLLGAYEDASLQLNSILVVTHASSAPGVYWPQNVPVFNTGCGRWYYADDDVLNMTGDGAYLTNQSITSANGGFTEVCPASVCGSDQAYYGIQFPRNYDQTHMKPYALPLAFYIFMNATVIQGQGVQISMGIKLVENGTVIPDPRVVVFDTITLQDPLAQTAFFYVTGAGYTPVGSLFKFEHGSFYDTELVFGGGGGGASQNFTSLAATIGLLYADQTGKMSAFPSYFSFGGDTGETTHNLHVAYLGGGVATVGVGAPNYEYLVPGSTPTGTSSFSNTSTSTAAPGSFPYLYVAVAVVALAALAGGALFLKKGRGGSAPLPPPPPPG